MVSYFVMWEIDVKAESAEAAAREAQRIQRDPESIATVFKVIRDGGEVETIDLLEPSQEQETD